MLSVAVLSVTVALVSLRVPWLTISLASVDVRGGSRLGEVSATRRGPQNRWPFVLLDLSDHALNLQQRLVLDARLVCLMHSGLSKAFPVAPLVEVWTLVAAWFPDSVIVLRLPLTALL